MKRLMILMATAGLLSTAQAGYIIEIDTDGADDGVLTYNADFSFGGDTTTASQSATATVFGATGGDSIFGGDGSARGYRICVLLSPWRSVLSARVREGRISVRRRRL